MNFNDVNENHAKGKKKSLWIKYIIFLIIVLGIFPAAIVTSIMFNILIFVNDMEENELIKNYPNLKLPNPKRVEEIESWIMTISLGIVFTVVLILFWKKRFHHLINYRPINLCMITGICSAIYCVLLPVLIFYFKEKEQCWYSLVFTTIFAPMSMMANLSRYAKLFLLNRRDVGRLKLFSKKSNSIFPESDAGSLGTNFEPNTYVKRLNQLVSKQITIYGFVVPYIILVTIGAFTIYQKSQYGDKKVCSNRIILYLPIMILSLITGILLPYFYLCLKPTLNIVNKFDIYLNFFSLIGGSLLFMSTLFVIIIGNNNFYLFTWAQSNQLFFLIPSFASFVCANVLPLIEVFLDSLNSNKRKFVSKAEFTKFLMGSRYIESLKSTAVKCYCVELVLFWDMHMKLMKNIHESVVKPHNERLQLEAKANEIQEKKMLKYKKINNNEQIMECKNISSPMPSNYELLLELNKNIFGNDNDKILYRGCYTRNGIDPNLINYAIKMNDDLRRQKMMNIDNQNNYYNNNNNHSNNSNNNNYKHHYSYTLTIEESNYQSNDITMMNPNKSRAFSIDESNQGGYGDSRPSLTVTPNSKYPLISNSYNYESLYNGQNNNNFLQKNNLNIFNNNTDNNTNSDKAGLLRYSNSQSYSTINNHDNTKIKGSLNKNSSIATYNRIHQKNPLYDTSTEILYELFNINPEHVELPPKYWKDYNNIYHSFISDRSLATVNLEDSTVNSLKRAIDCSNYTIDMFFPALSETIDLMYQNLYPKLEMKNE